MSKEYDITENRAEMALEPTANYAAVHTSVFTDYQMQILDSIANVRDESEMRDIRNLIADYFSNKALDAMDKLCEEGELSTQAIEGWQAEHMRTPYRY